MQHEGYLSYSRAPQRSDKASRERQVEQNDGVTVLQANRQNIELTKNHDVSDVHRIPTRAIELERFETN